MDMRRDHKYESVLECVMVGGPKQEETIDDIEFLEATDALEALAGADEDGTVTQEDLLRKLKVGTPARINRLYYKSYSEYTPPGARITDNVERRITLAWDEFISLGKPYTLMISDSYVIEPKCAILKNGF